MQYNVWTAGRHIQWSTTFEQTRTELSEKSRYHTIEDHLIKEVIFNLMFVIDHTCKMQGEGRQVNLCHWDAVKCRHITKWALERKPCLKNLIFTAKFKKTHFLPVRAPAPHLTATKNHLVPSSKDRPWSRTQPYAPSPEQVQRHFRLRAKPGAFFCIVSN